MNKKNTIYYLYHYNEEFHTMVKIFCYQNKITLKQFSHKLANYMLKNKNILLDIIEQEEEK